MEFPIFEEQYIEILFNMKEKNLAAELLARLLKDGIKIYKRTNPEYKMKELDFIE